MLPVHFRYFLILSYYRPAYYRPAFASNISLSHKFNQLDIAYVAFQRNWWTTISDLQQ